MIETSITKWIKKKIRRLIGIVEDGDTATHSIAAGKYVVWKGNLCKASTAIAIGTTLSTSNLTAVSDGGLNEINGNITKIDGYYSLLTKTQTTSSYSTKNLYASRKFSDYEMIGVIGYRGEWMIACAIVPTSWFTDATGVALMSTYNSISVELDVKYTSDTQVDIKEITSDTGSHYVRIYGIFPKT